MDNLGHSIEGYKKTRFGFRPKEWIIGKVGDFTLEHKQGFYTTDSYVEKGNVKLLRISDLLNPLINFDNAPQLSVTEREYEQFKVNVGDFLIARSGAIGRYGICYQDKRVIFASYLIRFKFDQSKMLNEYFGALYESPYIIYQLGTITQGSSNKNINAENIKSLEVILPPSPSNAKSPKSWVLGTRPLP